jgi:hypothetical protein
VRNQVKHSLLSILVVLSCCCSFGQQDTSFSFIEDAIRSRKGIDKIVYLDTSFSFYQPLRSFVKNGHVLGYKGQAEVKMKFTKQEVNSIDEGFKIAKLISWKDDLFANSVRIKQDTLLLLGKGADSRAYFHQHFAEKYFYISQPVFARNGTVAIFRLAEMIGPSAGYDFLYIYVKEKDKWEQKMFIHAGAW